MKQQILLTRIKALKQLHKKVKSNTTSKLVLVQISDEEHFALRGLANLAGIKAATLLGDLVREELTKAELLDTIQNTTKPKTQNNESVPATFYTDPETKAGIEKPVREHEIINEVVENI